MPSRNFLEMVDSHDNLVAKIDPTGALTAYGMGVQILGLAAPASLSVESQGSQGSTSYGYRVSALGVTGVESSPCPEVIIANGPATLSTTNRILVTWAAVPGAISYNVYGRTAGAEKLLGAVQALPISSAFSFIDTGAAAPTSPIPQSPAGSPVVIQAAAGQSGPLVDIRDEKGSSLFTIGPRGPSPALPQAQRSVALPKPTTAATFTWTSIGQAAGLSPGYITRIRFDGVTVDATWRIRITVDGAATPQVNLLLSEFFGYKRLASNGVFRTAIWGQSYNLTASASGLGAELVIPIPFQSSFNIEIWPGATGGLIFATTEYVLDKSQAGVVSRYHLFADSINIEAAGLAEVTWFDSAGECVVAGVMMDLYSSNANHWPLEGLVRFYYGGANTPAYTSPGTEDFFGSSFYFNEGPKAFDSAGMNYNTGGITVAWRWWLTENFKAAPYDPAEVKITWTNGWNYLSSGDPGQSNLNVIRFYYAQAPAPAFDPATLSNAILLDASSGVYSDNGVTPATADGTAVQQWVGTNGLTANQASAGIRPVLKTAVANGKNIIRFGGTQYFKVTESAGLDLTGGVSMYAAVSFADYNANRYVLERGAGSNPWYFLFYLAASGIAGGFTSGAGVHYDYAVQPSAASFHIVGATYDAGSGNVIIDIDGVETHAHEASSGAPISGAGDLFIGSDRAQTAGAMLVGDLGAVFIGPSLSAANRAKLRQIWRAAWGTP